MTRKVCVGLLAFVAGVLLFSGTSWAHHSFTAEFDIYQPVVLNNATITKVEWINPHAQIYVDVKNADGKVESWKIESFGTGNLHRAGLKRERIPVGAVLTSIRGYRAKDGSNMAYLRNLEFSDGTKMELWIGGADGTPDQ